MNKTIPYLLAFFIVTTVQLNSIKAQGKNQQPMVALPKTSSVTTLAELVKQRLSYMKDVAAYKWKYQLPIEDLEREQVVLLSSMEQAATYGLDSASSQAFFEVQITSAKLIQQYWFDQWTTYGFDEQLTFRDLNSEVRPALLELGNQTLEVISGLKLWEKPASFITQERVQFTNMLTTKGLPRRVRRLLYQAAAQISQRT
jgi:chorismate mutase-like protein